MYIGALRSVGKQQVIRKLLLKNENILHKNQTDQEKQIHKTIYLLFQVLFVNAFFMVRLLTKVFSHWKLAQ